MGKPGFLGPATINMPSPTDIGSIQWMQEKLGCIAYANFIPPATHVNRNDVLPSPPPPSNEILPTTLQAEGVALDYTTMNKLTELAAARDA